MFCNCNAGDPWKNKGDDKCVCILKIRDNEDCTGTICTEAGNITFQMPPVSPINGPLSDADSLQEMLNTTSECLKELKEKEDDAGTDDQTAAEVFMASGETVEACVTANKQASAANTAAIAALVDQNTTYTFSNAVPNADGSACIITVTGSDGSTQTSSVPKPVIPVESGVYLASVPPAIDLDAATITYQTVNDVDETPGAPVVQDISSLIAFLTSPMYVAGSNITLVDNGDGTVTINATDTFVTVTQDATGTTFTPAGGGTPVFIPADVDVVAATAADLALCDPTNDAAYVTPLGMDTWLDMGFEFTDAAHTHTNDCVVVTSGSIDSTVTPVVNASGVFPVGNYTTFNSTITDVGSVSAAIAAVNTTFGGSQSLAAGLVSSTIARANRSVVSGISHNFEGIIATSHVSGSGTTQAAGTQINASNLTGTGNEYNANLSNGFYGGLTNTIDDVVANSGIVGSGNQISADVSNSYVGGTSNEFLGDTNANIVVGDSNTLNATQGPVQVLQHSAIVGNNNLFDTGANNFLGGARNNIFSAFSNVVVGEDNRFNQLRFSGIFGQGIVGRGLGAAGTSGTVTFGRNFTVGPFATDDFSVVGGFGGAIGDPSSARTIQLESQTGNIRIAGALVAGFVFPGAGEEAIPVGKIEIGDMVVFEGMTKVRIAKEGERPDGVAVKELAVCFGGGYELDNTPFMIDDHGSYIHEEREEEYEEEIPAVYEEEPIMEEVNGEKVQVGVKRKIKKKAKKVKRKRTVKGLVSNPDYDAERHNKIDRTAVEMIGRNWVTVTETVVAGDYVGAGGKKVDPALGFRVLEINKKTGMAGVLIK